MSTSNKKRCLDNVDDEPADTKRTHFSIKSRKDDFNGRNWWMVDIDNCDSNQGATALVKRCMRCYDWSLDHTKKILQAYRQFLTLKKEHQDWDATILSPSHLVDQMWHQHILDIGNYCHDMIILCDGEIILHNPDGALDQQAKKLRDARTHTELIKKFGSDNVDSEVWGYPSGSIMLDIVLKDPNNNEMTFLVKRERGLYAVIREYANRCGINQSEHKFVYNGNRIYDYDTPGKLKMENGDAIDVIPFPVEWITVSIKDQAREEMIVKIKTSTKMGKVFQAYADRKGMGISSLRFLFDGDRIKDHETARCHGMKDGDRIDAVLDQGGC